MVGMGAVVAIVLLLLERQQSNNNSLASVWMGSRNLLLDSNAMAFSDKHYKRVPTDTAATAAQDSASNNTKEFFAENDTIHKLLQTEYFKKHVSTAGVNQVWKEATPHAASWLPPGKVYGGPMISCHDSDDSQPVTNVKAPEAMTIIFTFSARYCNPDLQLFTQVWDSHVQHMPLFLGLPKHFVFDGFGDIATTSANSGGHRDQRDSATAANQQKISLSLERYGEFQQRLEAFVRKATQEPVGRENDNPPTLTFYPSPTNVGPVTLLRTIIPTVTTPIIYVAQDDFALNIALDTQGIMTTMLNAAVGYNHVRYLLLAKDYPKSRLPKTFFWKSPWIVSGSGRSVDGCGIGSRLSQHDDYN